LKVESKQQIVTIITKVLAKTTLNPCRAC